MAKRVRKERKIDTFVILAALDQRDMTVYDQISVDPNALAEYRREIGYMLPLWMTGSSRDSDHIELIQRFNRYCNANWFSLYGHPRIQSKLLAQVGLGRKTPHRFHRVRSRAKFTLMEDLLRVQHPDIRDEQIQLWARKHRWEDAENLAQALGWNPEQISQLKTEFESLK